MVGEQETFRSITIIFLGDKPPCTSYSPDQKNCSVEKLTATLNKFNKCYEWKVRENFLFNSDSSSSVPLLSLRNVVSSPFIFFLRLLQPKTKHCVPNVPIFLTAYNNYVAKVVTPIWRRLNFAGFIFFPSRHTSCSIQSYFSDQWLDHLRNAI